MKASQKLFFLMVVLAFFALACGLGSSATDKIDEVKATAEAAATQVGEVVETAGPVAETAAANVEKLATEMPQANPENVEGGNETGSDTDSTGQSGADTDSTGQSSADTDSNAGDGGTEVAPLDLSMADSALAQFSSYRAETTITIEGVDQDGNPVKGSMTSFMEATKDPEVSHASMSGSGDIAQQGGGTEGVMIEWYTSAGNMYLWDPTSNEWSMLPADSSMFGDMLLSATDVVDIPKSAKRSLLPVDVNGISTWHYTFDASDFPPDPTMDIKDGQGEAWIARDGNYPVKMQFELTAKTVDPNSADAQLFSEGSMIVTYELKDVNKNFEIVIPEEALNATSMFGGDTGSGDTGSGGSVDVSEIPMMDDADVQFSMAGMTSYNTAATPAEVIDFYRTEMAKLGWDNNPDNDFTDETGGFLDFTKDGTTVSLVVDNSSGDGTTNVSILSQ